jgi:hypothetical protein
LPSHARLDGYRNLLHFNNRRLLATAHRQGFSAAARSKRIVRGSVAQDLFEPRKPLEKPRELRESSQIAVFARRERVRTPRTLKFRPKEARAKVSRIDFFSVFRASVLLSVNFLFSEQDFSRKDAKRQGRKEHFPQKSRSLDFFAFLALCVFA